jgi:hypothetical protein
MVFVLCLCFNLGFLFLSWFVVFVLGFGFGECFYVFVVFFVLVCRI